MGLNGGLIRHPLLFTGTLVAMVVVSPPFALLVTETATKAIHFDPSIAFR
jgi:hypothetical protein